MSTDPKSLAMLALVVLLAIAVTADLRMRKVPNRLVLTGLILALPLHAVALLQMQSPLAGDVWWAPLTGALVGLFALMPLYAMRACGAGDVKLMCMVGAFIGAKAVGSAIVWTLLAGGALSLIFMVTRGVTGATLQNVRYLLTDWGMKAGTGQSLRLAPLAHTTVRLPYAVAIACGTALALAKPLFA